MTTPISVRIYEIVQSALSALLPKQMGVESVADADLSFQMWGGKDDNGNVTKWLAKDKAARLDSLTVGGINPTGSGDNESSINVSNRTRPDKLFSMIQYGFDTAVGVVPYTSYNKNRTAHLVASQHDNLLLQVNSSVSSPIFIGLLAGDNYDLGQPQLQVGRDFVSLTRMLDLQGNILKNADFVIQKERTSPIGLPDAGYSWVWIDETTGEMKIRNSDGTERTVLYEAVAIVDFSSTTVSGWASIITKQIFYRQVGQEVDVWLYISGIGNTDNTYVTLPYAAISTATMPVPFSEAIKIYISGAKDYYSTYLSNDNILLVYNGSETVSWGNGVQKIVTGHIKYIRAA